MELVALEERLEAAVTAVMRELDATHVEGRRIRRDIFDVVHEYELRLPIDEAPDEPRACSPVDVAVLASGPLTRRRPRLRPQAPRSPVARARSEGDPRCRRLARQTESE